MNNKQKKAVGVNYLNVGGECCKKCKGFITATTTTNLEGYKFQGKRFPKKFKVPQCKNSAFECHVKLASAPPVPQTSSIQKIEKIKIERVGKFATFPEGSSMAVTKKSAGLITEAGFPIIEKINEIIDRLNSL